MPDRMPLTSMDSWLADVRSHCNDSVPELLPLLNTYAEEAAFGRRYIAPDLQNLAPGAKVLEIGAGSLLLSCQLVREGFNVTALEPVAGGFSHFTQLQKLVAEKAAEMGCIPRIINTNAEALPEFGNFDFAFSINVMEHVGDIARVLANAGNSLSVGAYYRFICPNYLFPYEPHFNIPTLFSKSLTEKILKARIFNSKKMPDPAGTWQSLNWITVLGVKNIARQLPELRLSFNRRIFVTSLERIATDQDFASRRSPFVRKILLLLVSLRIHRLAGLIPAMFQPVMDCRLQKISKSRED